ncbi:class I SAM-dependent methyltransferase [Algivirga pacifica]|uniref:Methyltransferase domain-containing protein n=1 Tax=Algivirga pacifica TaxID=1162670 RepID=A0ABP9DNB1_9BACT
MQETVEKEYSPEYVSRLFDRMASTYGVLNYISSFGFTEIWRKRCINNLDLDQDENEKIGYDLMSGMGECFSLIKDQLPNCALTGLDISETMTNKAIENISKKRLTKIAVQQEDVFFNSLESNTADFITSAFGLKTFNHAQLQALAKEVYRLLKSNGKISFIEISIPNNSFLKPFFVF